jgi:hypothetical protein
MTHGSVGDTSPDSWISVHTPGVRAGRVQSFGSLSPYLVKDGYTCLGLQYFVNEGGDLWNMSDDKLIALATTELTELGLVDGEVEAGYVVLAVENISATTHDLWSVDVKGDHHGGRSEPVVGGDRAAPTRAEADQGRR